MQYRSWLRRLILLSLFAGLTACHQAPATPLRVASSPWPGYEPLYLARDLGYLDPKLVHVFELPSADINMEAFRNGSAEVATLTIDEVMSLLHDGIKLKVLAVMDSSNGGDAVVARQGIKRPADIKGKRIAIVNIPLGQYMLSRLLDKAGLQQKDVHIFPMSDSHQFTAYKNGEVDVAITYEPFKSQIIGAGGHVIFDSSQIPNEILDLIVVREKAYQERPEEVCNLVRGWFRALDYIHSNNDDAMARMAKRLSVSGQEFRVMWSGILVPNREENQRILSGDHPTILSTASHLFEVMRHEGLLSHPVQFDQAIDPDFAKCYR